MPDYQAQTANTMFGGLPAALLFVHGLFDERWKVEIEAETAKLI